MVFVPGVTGFGMRNDTPGPRTHPRQPDLTLFGSGEVTEEHTLRREPQGWWYARRHLTDRNRRVLQRLETGARFDNVEHQYRRDPEGLMAFMRSHKGDVFVIGPDIPPHYIVAPSAGDQPFFLCGRFASTSDDDCLVGRVYRVEGGLAEQVLTVHDFDAHDVRLVFDEEGLTAVLRRVASQARAAP